MNIVMVTNSFRPQVGGVARSVERFSAAYRARGHNVLVVAPTYEGLGEDEPGVVRVPALQRFNGSDFSVSLPAPLSLTWAINEFRPDIFHSHHPFLVGDTALRMASMRQVPIVFTYHTMYELYTHYVPFGADVFGDFAKRLSVGYANLCKHVIAPSEYVARLLLARGVQSPISVIPTGVDTTLYAQGIGEHLRRRLNIPQNAFVVGHVGRLAPEKNLNFLANAVCRFLQRTQGTHFIAVGAGPSQSGFSQCLARKDIAGRIHMTGQLGEQDVVDAYAALDLFIFSSKTETQGMVIVEAMAAGCPVVALDAPAVNEAVCDYDNGRLVRNEDPEEFAQAMCWVAALDAPHRAQLRQAALATARTLSVDVCAEKCLSLYEEVASGLYCDISQQIHEWKGFLNRIEEEWNLWANRFSAVAAAVAGSDDSPHQS